MTEQTYTIKDLIRDLQKLADEHGEETRVLASKYNGYVDQREIVNHDELSFEVREVTRDEARWTTDSTVTAGKALVVDI